jgi:integrase
VLIIAADTGLRENELFTLEKRDIDFGTGVINVRAIKGQTAEEVKTYGLDVLRQLREALVYSDISDFIAAL